MPITQYIIKKATKSAPKYLKGETFYYEKGDWVCQEIGWGASGTGTQTNKLTKKVLKSLLSLVKENEKNAKVKK